MPIVAFATNASGHLSSLLDDPHSIFTNASFVATDTDGRIAITDADARKVWIVSADRTHAHPLEYAFDSPHGVAFDSEGRILVADRKTQLIHIFNKDGTLLRGFGGRGSTIGCMYGPLGIAAAPDGTIYVTEGEGGRLQAFHADGTARWFYPHFSCPTAVAFDAAHNVLWAADWTTGTVTAFEFHDAEHLRPRHTLPGFWRPHGLAVDSRGLLHVSDGKGYYIYERVADADDSEDVQYLRILEDERFAGPPFASGIAEAKNGDILVCHGPRVATIAPIQIAQRKENASE